MLKAFVQSQFGQSLLGGLVWLYMVLVSRTTRWTITNREGFDATWRANQGMVACVWHASMISMPALHNVLGRSAGPRREKTCIIASRSREGNITTRACTHLGLQVIRGSAANKKKQDKDKGGREALMQAHRALLAGGMLAITPDGPRGPRHVTSAGPILMARRANVPLYVVGIAAGPAKRLKTWDRLMLPGLFGRGGIVVDGPVDLSRGRDTDTIIADINARLTRASLEAERLAGLTPLAEDLAALLPAEPR